MPTISPPSNPADPAALLEQIDAKLARIEARLAKLDPLLDAAPGLIAMAGDGFDELAAELGDLDARIRGAVRLLERATRPETLTKLEAMLDMLDAAPGLIAMLGDTFDEFALQAQARGLALDAVVPELGRALEAALVLLTHEQVRELLVSDLLLPSAIEALGVAARALGNAQRGASPRLGLIGTLSAMREPEVQRAVGFAIDVARRFGTSIEPHATAHALAPSKAHEHDQ